MVDFKDSDFENYRQLLGRIDAKFAEIQSKHSSSFSCKSGCFSCCKGGLTVTHVEAAHIRHWLKDRPELKTRFYGISHVRSGDVEFCNFLDHDGNCSIYEARPVVCRSHGAPLLVPSEEDTQTFDADVCPLNFQEGGLESLGESDWIRLDTLNTILSAIDRQFDADRAGRREPLDPTLLDIPVSTNDSFK